MDAYFFAVPEPSAWSLHLTALRVLSFRVALNRRPRGAAQAGQRPRRLILGWPAKVRSGESSMARSILSVIVTLGLFASGDVCAWVCQIGSAPTAVHADAGAHCGTGSQPEAPAPVAPSHEDCPGCALDTAATSGALEGLGATDFSIA